MKLINELLEELKDLVDNQLNKEEIELLELLLSSRLTHLENQIIYIDQQYKEDEIDVINCIIDKLNVIKSKI